MDLGLRERVALVTGGSRGIGRAVALQLGAEGAAVGVGFRTEARAAEDVVAKIESMGSRALVVPMDLADDASLDTAVETVASAYGRLDSLINNAGSFPDPGPFEDKQDGQVRTALRLNFEGPARLIQRATPLMKRDGFGRIVNVSSIHAADGAAYVAAHTASKSALHGLSRSLARELGPDGILVNVVMPGLTVTEAVRERFPKERVTAQAADNPTRRNSSPEDVSRLICFLSSPANAYINGALIRHDGGL